MAKMDVLFTVDALEANNVAVTLRFSESGYIDNTHNLYAPRILKSAWITVSPNDGGVLPIFNEASVGDIELLNNDGGLDYLADYATDGRAAVLSVFDGITTTELFSGTISGRSEQNGVLVFHLRARHESLTDNHPANTYAGDNVATNGLEGTADDILGKNKPRGWGDCRNAPAVLVNESLLIYQASDVANALITAVYDDGIRLLLWRVDGLHAQGATTITLKNGENSTIAVGAKVVFGNHDTVYTVQTGLSAASTGNIVLTFGLTQQVTGNTAVEVVNFFANTNALQYYNYVVAGEHNAGDTVIHVTGGSGAINVGDNIHFSGHVAIYTVAVALSGGALTLDKPLVSDLDDNEHVLPRVANAPELWGGYQGYFRLRSKPEGAVTCDFITVTETGTVHQAGDVVTQLLADVGYTVHNAGVFNAAGIVGLFFSEPTATKDLLGQIAKSVAGYYWFVGSVCYLGLLDAPATTPDWIIEDYQIIDISRVSLGAGRNGLPLHTLDVGYDRIETTQANVDGRVSDRWKQRLSSQYRRKTVIDSAVSTRHPLSVSLVVDSLLRTLSDVTTAFNRLFNVVKTRRDTLDLTIAIEDAPLAHGIGSTGRVVTPRLGYASGRKLLLLGYQIKHDERICVLRLFG